MSEEQEQPQLSLAQEMAAVAQELGHESAEPVPPTEPTEAEVPVHTPPDAEAQDQASPEVAEPGGTAEPSGLPTNEDAGSEPPAFTPPQHWSKADKEQFEALDEAHKQWWLDKAKSLENQQNTKLFELENEKREATKLLKAIEPFQQEMQARGLSPDQVIGHLVARWNQLSTDPGKTVPEIARQYASAIDPAQKRAFVTNIANAVGVQLDALDGLGEDLSQPEAPETAALRQELQELKAEIRGLSGTFQQTQQTQVDQSIASVRAELEHYDALEPKMAGLIKGGLVEQGVPSDMVRQAYKMALAMTPELQPKPPTPPRPTGKTKTTSVPATTPTAGSNGVSPPAKLRDGLEEVFLSMGGQL